MKVKVKLHDRSDVMNFIEKYVLNKYGIQVVDMFNGDITMRDAVFIYELSSSFITNLLNKSQWGRIYMNKEINDDLEYIKKFSSITITKACEKAKVDKANLYKGIASKKKIKLVKKILESEVAKLYIIKDE